MMDIYVPSYNRPNAPVIRKFIEAGIPFTIVLDHKEDAEAYKKHKDKRALSWRTRYYA